VLAALCILAPSAPAHDADVYGGLFRSRDAGANWVPVNPGVYSSGALALAVSPRDANHLLLATESGVWRSRNAGRDWEVEAPDVLSGAVLDVAFDADGERALAAGLASVLRRDGGRWRAVATPAGAAPARAIAAAPVAGRAYLAGHAGLYRTDNWGGAWTDVGTSLGSRQVDQVVVGARPDDVLAVAAGSVWWSRDAGRTWRQWGEGAASGIEAIGVDRSKPAGLWAVADGQVLRSDQPGERWRTVGDALPEKPVRARVLAVLGDVIIIGTDRGVFRSTDGAARWEPPRADLPAHLAAELLVADPAQPATLFAGFALTSAEALRRGARDGAPPPDSLLRAYGSTLLVLAGLLAVGLFAGALNLARTRGAARAAGGAIDRVPR
jgi:photosystem II stability/assembly factor-like uncharacterized protein